MKPQELKESLSRLIDSKVPTFIWGSPGIGKSSIVKQIANEKSLDFIDLRLSLLDPTDLKGIPFFDSQSKEAVWAKPEFLPKSGEGILFLDEINSAPPSVQAAAYQLVLDRKVGDYELPSGWAIVAAGNLESDRGVVYKMPSPLSNRFVHLYLEVNLDDWKRWAYSNNLEDSIIAFLSYAPQNIFKFNPDNKEKAFATPRSWEYVDTIIKSNIPSNSLLEVISGAVGKETALEFISFRRVANKLPDIKELLSGKDIDFQMNNEVIFALISGIINYLKREPNKINITNAIKLSFKLPKEFAVMLIKDMQQNQIEIEDLEIFEEWVEKFAYLLE